MLMEFLNPTMRNHSQISSKSTFFAPKYPITRHRIKNPPNFNTSLSKFFLNASFPLNLSRKFRVSAHFGRPTSRKNYLRKKLTQSQHPQLQQQQVSQNPTIHHPSSNFDNPIDKVGSDSDSNSKLNNNDSLAKRGSEVTKFGVKKDELDGLGSSDGGLGFVSMIQKFTLDKPFVLDKWSIIGLTGLFGLVLVLVLGWKRLFEAKRGKKWYSLFTTKRGKERYTKKEKEMLRRKMKARSEREKLVKGSVEVIQDFKKPEITEKPRLDKQYLLNAIAKVMGENVNLWSQLLLDTGNRNSMEFDSKIEEIRRMVRHAREIEKSANVEGGIYDTDDSQIVSDISNANEVIDIKSTSLDNQLDDHTERPLLDKQDLMNTIDPFSLKVPFVTPVSESTDFDSENEGIGSGASRVREIEAEKEQTVNGFSNEKQVILKKSTSSDVPQNESLSETPYPRSSMPEDNPVKSNPRIFKSVKEAREYLSKRRDKQR